MSSCILQTNNHFQESVVAHGMTLFPNFLEQNLIKVTLRIQESEMNYT